QLAAKYRKTTGSTLPVTGEISRFDVAKALDLQLIDDLTLGYDAIGRGQREGLRILIKGRVIFDDSRSTHRVGQIKSDGRWDRVIMVLFDGDYAAIEMHEATSEDIEAALDTKPESANK